MNILMVTKFVPLPADSGGKRRSLAVLDELTRHGDVTLCAFRDARSDVAALERRGVHVLSVPWRPTARRVAAALPVVRSVSSARFWDPRLRRAVQRAAEAGVDHLQVEYTQLAPYASKIEAARRVLDMHNVESALARSYTSARPGLRGAAARLEATALRRLEARSLARFDVTAVVSDADRARLPSTARVVVVPNGWDPSEDVLPPATEPVAAFVALLQWAPNDDAATWLLTEIWPLVRARMPDARLVLVGREPSARVRSFHGAAGVEVTGSVPDVRPHLARARIGLAPLRAGGGSRLKILESLDAGRPVVATSKGAEGLEDLRGEGVEVQDDAAAFAEAVVRLLKRPGEAEELGRRGHDAVAARHSWTDALSPLRSLFAGGSTRGDAS